MIFLPGTWLQTADSRPAEWCCRHLQTMFFAYDLQTLMRGHALLEAGGVGCVTCYLLLVDLEGSVWQPCLPHAFLDGPEFLAPRNVGWQSSFLYAFYALAVINLFL